MSEGAVETSGKAAKSEESTSRGGPAGCEETVAGAGAGGAPAGGAPCALGAPAPRRFGLAITSAAHALVFAIAAAQLPWPGLSWGTFLLGSFALGHSALALLSALGRERWVRPLWAGLAGGSLLVWLVLSVAILAAGLHLAALYQGIGAALAGGLFALTAVLALFTVPFACWGLAATRPWRSSAGGTPGGGGRAGRARGARSVAVLGLVLGSSLVGLLALAHGSGRVSRVDAWGETEPEALWARVEAALPAASRPAAESKQRRRRPMSSLLHTEPTTCSEPVTGSGLTALVTWLGRGRRPESRCVQAPTAAALESTIVHLLTEEAHARSRAVVDFVVAHRALSSVHPWLDAFGVRAARDGVCAVDVCLAPWQLVALGSFTEEQPLPAVPELRFGVSADALGRALGGTAASVAIETETYVLVDGEGERLSRLRRLPRRPEEEDVRRAVRAAERHIVSAQGKDGRFRYALDPFTGEDDWASMNLPRQAGTTLVLCELGRSKASRRVVKKSLGLLATHERRLGEASVLTTQARGASLGHTALPLVALLGCREAQGKRHDELILRLAEFVLQMQREDGSFHAFYDLRANAPVGEHEALYASGQAVFALVLLEQQLATLRGAGRLPAERVRSAIDRAMHHYAVEYWPRLLRDFFYVEENWHCLAARAALSSHRNPDYERFCIDYVAFKARLILRRGEVPSEDLVGGYGVSPVFEPHNTGGAGLGEGLAAALALQAARGEDRSDNLAALQDVLGFLVRAQWDAASCFACSPRHRVLGGFSEHVASSTIRIDYVQHAMAALGHGGHELFGAATPAGRVTGT